jgi:inosose dehydratase
MPNRFRFATAPVSWGVADYRDASWEQPYEKILDEMAEGGYTGTELGPYGYFPTDPRVLRPVLEARGLAMLSSFVPVNLVDADAAPEVIGHIREVGSLLAALDAPFIVLADAQSREREAVAGRVPSDDSAAMTFEQWRNAVRLVASAERVAADFGLDLVFHPHVGTYIETPEEVEMFFDAVSNTKVGLCLDTGHCYYGGGDPAFEAEKYKDVLRYVHIKDIDAAVLDDSIRKRRTFEQAVEARVFTQIGAGVVDFTSFFWTLARNGYSGWCVVEQDVKYGVATVDPKLSMAVSASYLRSATAGLLKPRRLTHDASRR